MIGEIIGAVSNIGQGMMNWGASKYNTDMTNRANKQMAEYSYSKDLEMWNRQNEYNSPAAQMARYKAAGLNPNLIYGSGGSAGNATTLPHYNAPQLRYNYEAPQIANTLQNFMDLSIKQSQKDLLQEQIKGKEIENSAKDVALGVWWKNNANLRNVDYLNRRADLYMKPAAYESFWKSGDAKNLAIEMANTKLAAAKLQLPRYSADTARIIADTQLKGIERELRQKEVNWYTAEKIQKMINSAIAVYGASKLGKIGQKVNSPTMTEYYNSMSDLNYARAGYYNSKY